MVTLFSKDLDFLKRLNSDFKNFIGFGGVDLGKRPPFYETVCTAGNDIVFRENDSFNATLVELSLGITVKHQMGFDKVTFPQDHGTILSTRDDLTIGKLLPA
jgi:hypothetical protein